MGLLKTVAIGGASAAAAGQANKNQQSVKQNTDGTIEWNQKANAKLIFWLEIASIIVMFVVPLCFGGGESLMELDLVGILIILAVAFVLVILPLIYAIYLYRQKIIFAQEKIIYCKGFGGTKEILYREIERAEENGYSEVSLFKDGKKILKIPRMAMSFNVKEFLKSKGVVL